MSHFFNLERDYRQGDPLSAYLFIIGVDIQGITINDDETLLSQYADDTFLILDGREISLKETLSCFESFYQNSGLKMNASKTKAVWVGNKKYSDLILCPESNLHWSHSTFYFWGFNFRLEPYYRN